MKDSWSLSDMESGVKGGSKWWSSRKERRESLYAVEETEMRGSVGVAGSWLLSELAVVEASDPLLPWEISDRPGRRVNPAESESWTGRAPPDRTMPDRSPSVPGPCQCCCSVSAQVSATVATQHIPDTHSPRPGDGVDGLLSPSSPPLPTASVCLFSTPGSPDKYRRWRWKPARDSPPLTGDPFSLRGDSDASLRGDVSGSDGRRVWDQDPPAVPSIKRGMRGGGLTYGLGVLGIDACAFWIAFGEFVFETCGGVGILGDVGLVGGVFFFETMLLALLFGRGGGGRPPMFGVSRLSSVIFVADERGLGPGELDRSVVARVCSSYSSAARRLCEILIVREPSRGGVAAPPGLVDIAMLIGGGLVEVA